MAFRGSVSAVLVRVGGIRAQSLLGGLLYLLSAIVIGVTVGDLSKSAEYRSDSSDGSARSRVPGKAEEVLPCLIY